VNALARIAELERELHWAQLEIQPLREKLRQAWIKQLGPRSESLSDLQLKLLGAEEEPSATREEVQAEAGREPLAHTLARERKPHPGRKRLPENLPRVTDLIACTETNCSQCGEPTTVMGYDESEQLDIEAARYFVRVTKREKRACRRCATVQGAPLAARMVEKGLASDAMMIHTVIAKYCDHLPLYRQAVIIEREAGVQIGRATLDGWVMKVGELLEPIVGAMRRDLLASSYLQADETPVPVQTHDQRGENHQAYLWQYGKPGGETVFDFCMGRERAGPKKFLGQWEGILQTDGYVAYENIGGPKLVHVGRILQVPLIARPAGNRQVDQAA
jgi:transposase